MAENGTQSVHYFFLRGIPRLGLACESHPDPESKRKQQIQGQAVNRPTQPSNNTLTPPYHIRSPLPAPDSESSIHNPESKILEFLSCKRPVSRSLTLSTQPPPTARKNRKYRKSPSSAFQGLLCFGSQVSRGATQNNHRGPRLSARPTRAPFSPPQGRHLHKDNCPLIANALSVPALSIHDIGIAQGT